MDLHGYGESAARPLGFGADELVRKIKKRISVKQLVDFGMLAEFLGRLPVMVQLHALGEDDLLRVLTEPPDSVLKEFRELLAWWTRTS